MLGGFEEVEGVRSSPSSSCWHPIYPVYLALGFLTATAIPVRYWLLDDHGLQPTTFEFVLSFATVAWSVKFLWAYLYDRWRCDYDRTLVTMMLTNALCWVLMSTWSRPGTIGIVGVLVLNSWSLCITDVITDGRMVEAVRDEPEAARGTIQSNVLFCRRLGSHIGGLCQTFLVRRNADEATGFVVPRTFFAMLSAVPIALLVVVSWGADDRVPVAMVAMPTIPRTRDVVAQIWRVLRRIWKPIVFIFLIAVTPGDGDALFLFETEPVSKGGLGLETSFIGLVGILFSAACMVSALAYRRWMRHVPLRVMFGTTLVCGFMFSLVDLGVIWGLHRSFGIGQRWLIFWDEVVRSVVWELCLLPIVVLITRLIPPGLETTLYALCTSIENAGGILSGLLEALLLRLYGVRRGPNGRVDFRRLWALSLTTSVVGLTPLLFLPWVGRYS